MLKFFWSAIMSLAKFCALVFSKCQTCFEMSGQNVPVASGAQVKVCHVCSAELHTCSAFAMSSQMLVHCLPEDDSQTFASAMMSLSEHRCSQLVSRFHPTGTQMVFLDWMTRFYPLCVDDWLIVSASRNKSLSTFLQTKATIGLMAKI